MWFESVKSSADYGGNI